MTYDQFTKRVDCAIHQIKAKGLTPGFSFDARINQATNTWVVGKKQVRHPLTFFLEGHSPLRFQDSIEGTSRAISRRLRTDYRAIRAFQHGYAGGYNEAGEEFNRYHEFGAETRRKVLLARKVPPPFVPQRVAPEFVYEEDDFGIW